MLSCLGSLVLADTHRRCHRSKLVAVSASQIQSPVNVPKQNNLPAKEVQRTLAECQYDLHAGPPDTAFDKIQKTHEGTRGVALLLHEGLYEVLPLRSIFRDEHSFEWIILTEGSGTPGKVLGWIRGQLLLFLVHSVRVEFQVGGDVYLGAGPVVRGHDYFSEKEQILRGRPGVQRKPQSLMLFNK